MSDKIFIEEGLQLTLKAYIPIASQTMSLIAEAAESVDEIGETFSVVDLSMLFDKVCAQMPGKFEIRRTFFHHYQIVYESRTFNEAVFEAEDESVGSVEKHNNKQNEQNCFLLDEKVLFAFINQKFYGPACALYFYLGYLMTRDNVFAVSHNISFKQIVESCAEFSASFSRHRTTLMRALADLQDMELIKWHPNAGTFEVLHITPYDPAQRV